MTRTPAFVPKQEQPKVHAVPLVYVKFSSTPRLPGYSADNIEYAQEIVEELVLYPFGVLIRLVKHGDFIVPLSQVLSAKPVTGIKWELNETCAYNPQELREICEARGEK
jgi:hypothetical protein